MSNKKKTSKTLKKLIPIKQGESRHHRLPRSRGGTDDPSNISVVKQKEHHAWHKLFSNLNPETVADLITQKWIPTNYRMVCVRID